MLEILQHNLARVSGSVTCLFSVLCSILCAGDGYRRSPSFINKDITRYRKADSECETCSFECVHLRTCGWKLTVVMTRISYLSHEMLTVVWNFCCFWTLFCHCSEWHWKNTFWLVKYSETSICFCFVAQASQILFQIDCCFLFYLISSSSETSKPL